MNKPPKHSNNISPCPECEEKLKSAHERLADWFKSSVKPLHPDCHISWSYRDKDSQEKAFLDGRSKLHFPLSAHNKSDDQGNPCSLALDFFRLDPNGMACWEWGYFRTISQEVDKSDEPIFWGGLWAHLGDSDHFELKLDELKDGKTN